MTSHDLPSPSLGPEDQDKDKGEGLEKPEYQSMSDVPAPAPTSQELKPALQAATPSTGFPTKAPPASSPLAPPASTPPPAGQDRLHSGLEYQFRAVPRPTLALRGHIREPPGASHPQRPQGPPLQAFPGGPPSQGFPGGQNQAGPPAPFSTAGPPQPRALQFDPYSGGPYGAPRGYSGGLAPPCRAP